MRRSSEGWRGQGPGRGRQTEGWRHPPCPPPSTQDTQVPVPCPHPVALSPAAEERGLSTCPPPSCSEALLPDPCRHPPGPPCPIRLSSPPQCLPEGTSRPLGWELGSSLHYREAEFNEAWTRVTPLKASPRGWADSAARTRPPRQPFPHPTPPCGRRWARGPLLSRRETIAGTAPNVTSVVMAGNKGFCDRTFKKP